MIYLDSAATTKIAPEVLQEMLPYLQEQYGNAGTLYKLGRDANEAVQKARAQVASLFNCEPQNIVFTSGGSESNNLVFRGIREHLLRIGKTHIITTAVEHDSLLKAADSLTKLGFDITYLKPDNNGAVSSRALERAITDDTGFVSIMHTNNETGAINPISDLASVCAGRGILFHSDCVQAAGCYSLDVKGIGGLSFASVSSHKLHGPKGVGALYVRDIRMLSPLIYGGAEQEYGLRGGTENVAGIVGFGKACELVSANLREDTIKVSIIKQRFLFSLIEAVGSNLSDAGIHINGCPPIEPGKILNLRIDGVSGETLLLLMDASGVCISAGSACRSHENAPSHVLTAMGLSENEASSSIRISFSRFNTQEEVERAAIILADNIFSLRHMQNIGGNENE